MQYTDTFRYRRRRRQRRARKLVLFVLLSFITLGFVINYLLRLRTQQAIILSPLQTIPSEEVLADTSQLLKPLDLTIHKSLEGTSGVYAVVVKNLKTGEMATLHDSRKYETASLYKLWIMATVYEQIDSGKLSKDKELVADIERLNKIFNIASESAEFHDGKLKFTTQSALTQMITISHNYAALLLSDTVKLASTRAFLKKHGFADSALGTRTTLPVSTAADIALFLEKLYNGELASAESTEEMIDLLKKQKLNHKIPKYLPKNVEIAHKTGELYGYEHDAGIVYLPENPYIIVILSESKSPTGAEERLAALSRDVYEYFSSRNN